MDGPTSTSQDAALGYQEGGIVPLIYDVCVCVCVCVCAGVCVCVCVSVCVCV